MSTTTMAAADVDRRPRLTEQRVEGLRVLLEHLVMWEPSNRHARLRYRQARCYLEDLILWDGRQRTADEEDAS